MPNARFHLAICVSDLAATRAFYGGLLGCAQGRTFPHAIDFSFFGHQLTCHLDPARVHQADARTMDGNHFGAILSIEEFHRLAGRLQEAAVPFLVPPRAQEAGTPAERWNLVVTDPSGNAVELKGYRDEALIFAPA
ncbi:MAG TPA: VOC family protein [Polyangia bacterium]|nr:VOC family protein [Polyangia bacterium]